VFRGDNIGPGTGPVSNGRSLPVIARAGNVSATAGLGRPYLLMTHTH
jgi:hypothetical protein